MGIATAVRNPRRAARMRNERSGKREFATALLFVAPAAVGFLTFFVYPTLRGFYLSLTDYSVLGTPEFVGLDNFKTMMGDAVFWNSLKVTTWYVVLNIACQTAIALGMAVLMHRLTKSTLIRGVLLFPYLIANVVVALLWFWLFDYQIGIVNAALDALGISRQAFFGNEHLAIPTIAFVNTWRHMGYTALLIFAGLQAIPRSVYEAGALDGASESKMFWHITLPLLRPILVLVLVITVTGSFQVFDTVAVTSKGGPGNASRVVQLYIFEQAFNRQHFGYASAISVVLFVLLLVVAVAQLKLLRGDKSDLN